MDGLENELEIELLKKNVYDLQEQLNSAHKKIADLIEQVKIYKRITNLKWIKDWYVEAYNKQW